MFAAEPRLRRRARDRWHPLFLRVYGIEPWQMGRYTLREFGALMEDLEKHGLGGGLGGA